MLASFSGNSPADIIIDAMLMLCRLYITLISLVNAVYFPSLSLKLAYMFLIPAYSILELMSNGFVRGRQPTSRSIPNPESQGSRLCLPQILLKEYKITKQNDRNSWEEWKISEFQKSFINV
jgi:hypothetical protein